MITVYHLSCGWEEYSDASEYYIGAYSTIDRREWAKKRFMELVEKEDCYPYHSVKRWIGNGNDKNCQAEFNEWQTQLDLSFDEKMENASE